MIYLITDNWHTANRWVKKNLRKTMAMAIRDGEVVPLSTISDYYPRRLQSRVVQPGDTVERIGRYDRGRYWQEIEDALKTIDRDGVLS